MNEALLWAVKQPGNWHDSGNLASDVLEKINDIATGYPDCVSAETGCGLSTIVLSHVSARHTSFTISDGNSASKVRSEPLFRSENVEFVLGPSQKTLPQHTFARPLHMALIDGAHGWPFPALDYYYFYPNIVPGGTLIVVDIHIPTVRQMYDVLCEDAMWKHIGNVRCTAFFQRTPAPLFNPLADGWWLQNFNKKRFENPESLIAFLGDGWWKT